MKRDTHREDLLPNFLVLGAAKAGTTSLYRYVSQHPQIYMSPEKEPGFFAFEGRRPAFRGPGDERFNRSLVTSLDEYLELFREGRHHPVRGEASVLYLYTSGTAERIHRHVPAARLVAVLRNPVDRAYSAYLHLRRNGREPVDCFCRALDLEEERISRGWQHMWHYRALSRYAEQVRRYLQVFPRRQILFLVFERFVADPPRHLQRIFRFLRIDPGFVPDSRRSYSRTGVPRRPWLHKVLARPTRTKKALRRTLPAGIVRSLQAARRSNLRRPPLPATVRERLLEEFRPDILELEELIGEDLGLWLGEDGPRKRDVEPRVV